ncbi:DUF6452 family protein [Mesonia aquimarina]|uniref:DUF6452 family protein n=1 Tax=Mesonia aquimarina TaxID=1504967 RepID=UPI0013CE9EFC|nr:DUF6452 family protein [Mesonia aquimarina]
MKKYLIILLCIFLGGSCQRDDICPETTQTTPNLVISFRDIENPSIPKAVTNLNIREENKTDYFYDEPISDTIAIIPLRNNQNFTNYYFTLNSEIVNGSGNPDRNKDQIQFSYATDEIFVSRACSYKTEFYELQGSLISDDETANWIESITIAENNIVDENTVHLFIYH